MERKTSGLLGAFRSYLMKAGVSLKDWNAVSFAAEREERKSPFY